MAFKFLVVLLYFKLYLGFRVTSHESWRSQLFRSWPFFSLSIFVHSPLFTQWIFQKQRKGHIFKLKLIYSAKLNFITWVLYLLLHPLESLLPVEAFKTFWTLSLYPIIRSKFFINKWFIFYQVLDKNWNKITKEMHKQ